jgi:tRNA nucleotidyltransferase/poly(A) polymerase
VAAERVRDELVKTFSSPDPSLGLALLQDLTLLPHILPEVAVEYRAGDTLDDSCAVNAPAAGRLRLLRATNAIVSGKAPASTYSGAALLSEYKEDLAGYLSEQVGAGLTRRDLAPWCSLFLSRQRDLSAPHSAAAAAEARLATLRFPIKAQAFVATCVREVEQLTKLRVNARDQQLNHRHRRNLYRYFRATRDAGVMIALLSLAAEMTSEEQSRATGDDATATSRVANEILETYFRRMDEIVNPHPLLTGRDLLKMGFSQGPDLGAVLENLHEAQASGEVTDETEARAWVARLMVTR